jgi:hypothetical protein
MIGSLYEIDSLVIAVALVALVALALAAGRGLGMARQARIDSGSAQQANAAQTAMLGLLALLLGFTFSMSLSRFDQRSNAIVTEANAIQTAWLRTDLLPQPDGSAARTHMRAYMAARIRVGAAVPGTEHDREVLVGTIATVQQQIWEIATAAAKAGGVVPMGFLLAANDMFDAFSAWNAVSQRHVPEVVMLLLFTTFAGMGFVMGYCQGIHGARQTPPVLILIALTIVAAFLIVDLDRPRRGFIQIDRSPLLAVETMMTSSP